VAANKNNAPCIINDALEITPYVNDAAPPHISTAAEENNRNERLVPDAIAMTDPLMSSIVDFQEAKTVPIKMLAKQLNGNINNFCI